VENTWDLVVVGGGPAGTAAALRAAELGQRVICVDLREAPGGTCLHAGCIPSKALLESSHLYWRLREEAAAHGIRTGESGFDLAVMMARKAGIVRELAEGLRLLLKRGRVAWVQGEARLAGRGVVEVQSREGQVRQLQAAAILLATGGAPVELPFLPFDGERVLSSTEALSLPEVPGHLVVVGGGAIGLELGQVWLRLGARVTVVELLPQIVPQGDAKLARLLQRSLKKQGMEIHTGARVEAASRAGEGIRLEVRAGGKSLELVSDRVLVAVGRKPCTDGLGLAEAGVETDPRSGRVRAGADFATTLEGVYAAGDLLAGPMLAHKGSQEGVAVAEIVAGKSPSRRLCHDLVPHVVYTWPEMAGVGLTEEAAVEIAGKRGRKVSVGGAYFATNGRARCAGDTDGMVKVIAEEGTGEILGIHILGPHASELVAEAVVAMEMGARARDLAGICHAHPTLSEALKEASLALERRPAPG